MPIDINTLMDEAKCLGCNSNASMAETLELAMLQRIYNNGGTGGGGTNNDFRAANYGGAQPSYTPTGSLGIAVDTGTEQIWWYYNGAWR